MKSKLPTDMAKLLLTSLLNIIAHILYFVNILYISFC